MKYKGKNFAVLLAIEEMEELTKELLKDINRHKDNAAEIMEELSDVYVFLEYLKITYGISESEIEKYINEKMPAKWRPRIEKWKARVDQTGDPESNKRLL